MRSFSRTLSSVAALALGLGITFGAAPGLSQQVTPPPAAPTQEASSVEPDALQALKDMSTYLNTLNAFEVHADTTRDLVTQNGHRVQLGGVSDYKVRRPSGFRIDVKTDYKDRQFFYDGKQFTVYAPQLGYYASAPAPATNIATINELESRFGIDLPLDDLFRWNDPASHQAENLSSGFYVGPATVDGVATDHYAFRDNAKQVDWEIWIQQGDQPLPRKLVIIDRSDEARPAYTARLNWTVNPTLAADTFTFRPGADAKQIRLATLDQ
jgi:hypothetical protein